MDNNQLELLEKYLSWKESKAKTAERLNVTLQELEEMILQLKLKRLREEDDRYKYLLKESPIVDRDEPYPAIATNMVGDTKKQTENALEVSAYWDHEPTPEEIIAKHKIDTTKWKLSTFWSKGKAKGYLVSAQFSPIKEQSVENFGSKFTDFLNSYVPKFKHILPNPIPFERNSKEGILIVNKQDAHLNKLDVLGKNNIFERFQTIELTLHTLVQQAYLSSKIEKIVFVVGSDEFNSEWNGLTTKGTPQQNILTYEESFEMICQHNLTLLQTLYCYCKNIDVIFVKGNHDEYVGWHLVKWLETTCKHLQLNIKFDTLSLNRKYLRYKNVGLMFNHGDALTAKDLAQIFPMEFREEWSKCTKFNIFTGDKHHEKVNTIRGIKAYQLPALSSAKSKWDDKNGHEAQAEMEVFLINGDTGNTYIYKEFL